MLNDVVRSGLVYSTGTGDGTVFGTTSPEVQKTVQRQHDSDSLANLAWLAVFRGEATNEAELAALLGVERERMNECVAELIAGRRLRRDGERLRSSNVIVPLGAEQG